MKPCPRTLNRRKPIKASCTRPYLTTTPEVANNARAHDHQGCKRMHLPAFSPGDTVCSQARADPRGGEDLQSICFVTVTTSQKSHGRTYTHTRALGSQGSPAVPSVGKIWGAAVGGGGGVCSISRTMPPSPSQARIRESGVPRVPLRDLCGPHRQLRPSDQPVIVRHQWTASCSIVFFFLVHALFGTHLHYGM